MNLTNTCLSCGTQFTSQQSSRCLRCILKNCVGSNAEQQSRIEDSVQKRRAAVPPSAASQPFPSTRGSNPNEGTSKAFLAWQAKQSQRLLLSQPKAQPAQHRQLFPAGSSPWRAPRIISMFPPRGALCVLCGTRVPDMLQHKYAAHGEEPVVRSPATARKDRRWLTIVSGGLPSLGKRSK